MDEDQPTKRIGREFLIALAVGTAMGLGAALGPDIADRARVWIGRAADAVEASAVRTVEALQHHAAIEREVKQGTGPLIWEAMTIVEDNQ